MPSTSERIMDDKASQHTPTSQQHPLERQMTLTLNTDQYERLFFQPSPPKGDLGKRFATPTLLGLLGFLIPVTSTTLALLRFKTASPSSFPARYTYLTYTFSISTVSSPYIFTGGLTMLLAGLLEYPLGNTFPFTVFTIYGTFWLSHGHTLHPPTLLALATTNPTQDSRLDSAQALFFLTMSLISFLFLLGSLRTNLPFVIIFFSLGMLFAFLSVGCFSFADAVGEGLVEGVDAVVFEGFQVDALRRMWFWFRVAGGWGAVAAGAGWYLAVITVCASTGMPCPLPIFDLSTRVFPKKDVGGGRGVENGDVKGDDA